MKSFTIAEAEAETERLRLRETERITRLRETETSGGRVRGDAEECVKHLLL